MAKDARPKDQVCGMCEGTINAKTCVSVDAPEGRLALCSPHCFFMHFSSLRDPKSVNGKILATDWASGRETAAEEAAYCRSVGDAERPIIKAFADKEAAAGETGKSQRQNGFQRVCSSKFLCERREPAQMAGEASRGKRQDGYNQTSFDG